MNPASSPHATPQSSAAATLAIGQMAAMPVPNLINSLLVVLISVLSILLLYFGSRASSWWALAALSVAFSYVQLTNYALLHEATHDMLHSDSRWNFWLGVVTGIFFLAPFSMIRVTHQGHHRRNRSDYEMFDLYYASQSYFLKCCHWYGTLCGLFWPCIPSCAVLFSACPRAVRMRLLSVPPWGNASLRDLSDRDIAQMRWQLLLTIVVFAGLYIFLELQWQAIAIMYACFSVNWSTRQYIAHAFTKRDVIEGALNLRHFRLMSLVLLNGEWDLNHHRNPDVSWYYLPLLSDSEQDRPSYFWQYWRQWRGPQLATEGPPQLPPEDYVVAEDGQRIALQ